MYIDYIFSNFFYLVLDILYFLLICLIMNQNYVQ